MARPMIGIVIGDGEAVQGVAPKLGALARTRGPFSSARRRRPGSWKMAVRHGVPPPAALAG